MVNFQFRHNQHSTVGDGEWLGLLCRRSFLDNFLLECLSIGSLLADFGSSFLFPLLHFASQPQLGVFVFLLICATPSSLSVQSTTVAK